MVSQARHTAVATLAGLLVPSLALANPMSLTGGVSLVAAPLLLPLEGLLIAMWAPDSSVYRARFVPVWTLVTTLTLWLMILIVEGLQDIAPLPATMIAGQLGVIGVEAWCIRALLGNGRFVRNRLARPGFGRSLAYSAGVNAVSFVGGIVALGLA
jgi:hypothetical protein